MLENIILGILFGFSMVGIFTAAYYLIFIILTPRKKPDYLVLLPLKEVNDPLFMISTAIEKRSLMCESKYCEIVIVNCGMAEDTLRFVKNLYGKTKNITITEYAELCPLLQKMFKEKDFLCQIT
ncbi:MAG: hypothetical protein FWF08_10195 [Oscillospiraceae bacterium]|nr:hypothetical protein [Oscillospiraceae bacterium]